MLGGGGGSSTTATTTTTEQFDERVAAENSVVVQLRDGSTLNVLDPGALKLIEEGLATFQGQIAVFEGLAELAIDFAQDESDKANALVMQVLEQDQTEDRQNFADLLKWGVVIVIGVTAIQAFKGR